MEIEPLGIPGAFVVTPRQFHDDRGVFLESFRGDRLADHLGHRPDVVQTNVSVSSRGTVRGIHLAGIQGTHDHGPKLAKPDAGGEAFFARDTPIRIAMPKSME